MKKKLSKISVLLVLMLTLAVCFAFGASAEETTYTEGYYTYTVTDGKATITAVDTAISGDITTPATLGGYPVTAIGEEAFYHCSGITSVVISEGVEVIDIGAFNDIGKVDSIVLPDSLTTLGEQPFTWVEIDSITVPANVTTIDPATFFGCYINKINVVEDNPYFSSDENGVLYNKDKTELLHVPTMYEGTLVVPETVKKIGIYGIYCCLNLDNLVLPEGLEELSEAAIGLVGIKELVLPASLKTIDENSIGGLYFTEEIIVDEYNPYFSSEDGVLFNKDKTSLLCYPEGKTDRTYVVPETVTSLYNWFSSALYLRRLTFSNNVDVLGSRGSHGCLTDIVFEEGITKIDAGLLNSYGFGKNIYIEGMNTEMPEVRAFQTYGIHNSNPDEYAEATLQLYMMYGIPMTEAESDVVYDEWDSYSYYYDTPVNNVTIHCHENSTAHTFAQENNISYSTTHFYKEDSEWILDFENNTATRECTGCTVTEKIYGYDVTDGEASIGKVYVELTGDVYVPETLDGYPVTGIEYFDPYFDNLYIHEGIKEITEGAFEGTSLGNIIVDENNPYFVVEDGALYDINKERLIKYFALNERTYFELPETVVKIDAMAFGSAIYLEEIKLNEGLKEIGDYAFGYTNISNIEFPSTLETIGEGAFTMCPMLEEITIPESVNYIADNGLFTYFPLEIYMESTNVTFGKYELFGVVDFIVDCTREEYAELLIYALEHNFDDESADRVESTFKYLDTYVAQCKYYCHEGANFIDVMDAAAAEYGVDSVYEYTHFFKDWTYDWENYERTAKCIHCDETTTEALEKPENIETETEIEIIAPVIDEDTKFVVETVEDEASEDYILVTEALEAVEGPAEIEKIYDITLHNSDNVAIQPDGSVQVKLPVENTHENYKVFRVNEDGTYTDMNATVVDGYVVFVTDHFSLYVIVDTTEAHEHSYTEEITKPATHMEEGEKTFTCSACGDSYTEVIEKDPKHYAELKYKSATCTEDGYERAVCECGFVMVDKVYEKLGHFYNYTVTLHPTHTREGSEIADCIRCDDTFINTIDKLPDHYYGYFVKTYDPTCTEGGYTVHQCSCGDSYTDSYTSALGHTRSKNGDWCSVCGVDMEPEKKDCDHMCHQKGFMGFIWSIVQFFWKLFKMNPVCECGAAHY